MSARLHIWLLLFVLHPAIAQHRLTNLQQHLHNYEIRDVLLDPDGSLWLATYKNGLVHYDGTTTKQFKHDPNNPNSIGENFLSKLFRDPKTGLLWILTANNGLSCYDPTKTPSKAFTNYPSDPNNHNSPCGNSLQSYALDDNGHLWLGGQDAWLTEFDLNTRQFTQYKDKNIDATIWSMAYTGNGNLWLATNNGGLAQFDIHRKQITCHWLFEGYAPKESNFSGFNTATNVLFEAQTNSLWVTADRIGLASIDLTTEKLTIHPTDIPLPTKSEYNRVSYIGKYHNGNIALGHSSRGLFIYNPHTQLIQQPIQESPTAKVTLPFNIVKVLYDSTQNLTWIATDKGLWLLDSLKNHYTPSITSKRLLPSEKILQIIENTPKNTLWLFTNKNLFAYNAHTLALLYTIELPPEVHTNMWSNLEIEVGDVYLHTSNRLWKVNEAQKRIEPYAFTGDITNICYDTLAVGEPIQWIATYNSGLYRLRQNGKMEHFTHLPNEKIINIYRHTDGKIWISHDNVGLVRLEDKEKVTFTHFINDPKNPNSLPDNIPLGMFLDAKKRLWLATASNGLALLTNPTEKVPIFNTFNASPAGNPFISGTHEDADGNLWLTSFATNPILFNPNNHRTQLLQPAMDVLPDLAMDSIKIGSGNKCVWIAHQNHIFKIDSTERFVFPQYKIPLHFTKLTVFDKDVSERLSNKIVELSHEENFFAIEFSAINFRFPKNTHYFYQLEGIDKNWVDAGTRNTAYYTNLSGGKYLFKVRASPNGDLNNATEATLSIVIHPPFWQTWWFYGLVGFTLGSMVYAFARYRLAHIRTEERLKSEFQQKLSESRFEILRSQMNPHFIFNCLNTIEGFIWDKKTPEASVFLQKFSKLIRSVLENSRHNTISIEQEVESLNLYLQLESIRYDKKFSYTVNTDENLLEYSVPPMLIQPFIENAILHGLRSRSEGALEVNIQEIGKEIGIMIIDNGIGRARAKAAQEQNAIQYKHSLGMKVTEERLKMFAPDAILSISDAYPNDTMENVGTKVEFRLPKKYNDA